MKYKICDRPLRATSDGGFTACPIGTFSTVVGAYTGSSCVQCPPGKSLDCSSVATTNTIYLYIHSHTFHFTFYCAGTFSNNETGLTSCFKCPKGTFQDTNQTSCFECPVGTSQPSPGQTVCLDCESGMYANTVGHEKCIRCAAGTYYSGAGAVKCDTCSAGTFQPQQGQAHCDECPAGGYCASNAAADTCDGGFTACQIGTFSTVVGAHTGSSCA